MKRGNSTSSGHKNFPLAFHPFERSIWQEASFRLAVKCLTFYWFFYSLLLVFCIINHIFCTFKSSSLSVLNPISPKLVIVLTESVLPPKPLCLMWSTSILHYNSSALGFISLMFNNASNRPAEPCCSWITLLSFFRWNADFIRRKLHLSPPRTCSLGVRSFQEQI